jgi:hypothetical protein
MNAIASESYDLLVKWWDCPFKKLVLASLSAGRPSLQGVKPIPPYNNLRGLKAVASSRQEIAANQIKILRLQHEMKFCRNPKTVKSIDTGNYRK